MSVKMNFDAKKALAMLNDLEDAATAVMPKVYQEFYRNTPIKTGNARRNTKLNKNEIEADYAYAGVLDAGRGFRDGQMRGSKQAPRGMTQPATKVMEQEVQAYIKKVSKG